MRNKSRNFTSDSPIANLLDSVITEKFDNVSQAAIAEAAGYPRRSANNISMFRSGASKLPIDRAVRISKFLEIPSEELVFMCMSEYYQGAFTALVESNLMPSNQAEVEAVTSLLTSMRANELDLDQ